MILLCSQLRTIDLTDWAERALMLRKPVEHSSSLTRESEAYQLRTRTVKWCLAPEANIEARI